MAEFSSRNELHNSLENRASNFKSFSSSFLIMLITYLIIVGLTEFTLTPLDIYSGKLTARKITFTECYLLPTWKRELFCFNISVAKVKIKKI